MTVPWLAYVGWSFRGIRKLTMWHQCQKLKLDLVFFASLAACPHLSSLHFGTGELESGHGHEQRWELGPEVAANTDIFRAWLPNVKDFSLSSCYYHDGPGYSLLPLHLGLAPQLEVRVVWPIRYSLRSVRLPVGTCQSVQDLCKREACRRVWTTLADLLLKDAPHNHLAVPDVAPNLPVHCLVVSGVFPIDAQRTDRGPDDSPGRRTSSLPQAAPCAATTV